MLTILIVALILAILVGSLPAWPYSRQWGYAPSGGAGLILVIVLVLLLAGYI